MYTNINGIVDEFNNISPILWFTPEQEQNNSLSFLDVTIDKCNIKSEWQFRISIYRKPTTTDCITPYSSCHPIDHRLAAIRYFKNRLNTYVLLSYDKEIEIQTIYNILCNKQFNLNIINQINRKKNKNTKKEHNINKKYTRNKKLI
jgi:hypothetical protein